MPLPSRQMPHHHQMELRKERRQLAQRRVDHRGLLIAVDPDQRHLAVGQGVDVEGSRHLQAPLDGPRHLDFRRDCHVDGHVVPAEEVGPLGIQIRLVADPRDLGRHVEDRMTNLAGHHVDLVGIGDRDHHFRIGSAGLLQHVGVGGEAHHALNVEGVGDLFHQGGGLVDHGDVGIFAGQVAGDVEPDLSGAADNDFHRLEPIGNDGEMS